MERDLLAFYGVDLFDLWCEGSRVTPDRALRLIRNLPSSAHTTAMYAGGSEYLEWDRTTAVLADIFDAVQGNTHALVMANTDKKNRQKVKEPDPYPRPGAKQKRSGSSDSSFAAIARAKLNARRGSR